MRDGRETAIPYCPTSTPGRRASSTDSTTWGAFENALAAADVWGHGVGYVLAPNDPFTGIDFDCCVDDGVIHPDVARLVQGLDSYTETSPSGTGLHTIVRAELNGGRNSTADTPWQNKFEIYDWARFFTVTGRHVSGTPMEINERQEEVKQVHGRGTA